MSANTVLPPDAAARVALLQYEIHVLREALDCVTDSTTPAVIYGRMDDLINQRQDQVLSIFQQARGAELAEVHTRG